MAPFFQDFLHLPAGCAIQLDRLSRRHVLENIRENLKNLTVQVPERLRAFFHETGQPLTFGNFIRHHDYEPERLLIRETWSAWKAKASLTEFPSDPDIMRLKNALIRLALTNGPAEIARLQKIVELLKTQQVDRAISAAGNTAMMTHYRIWAEKRDVLGMNSLHESFDRISKNPSVLDDMEEILAWAESETPVAGSCRSCRLHAPWSFMPNTVSKTF